MNRRGLLVRTVGTSSTAVISDVNAAENTGMLAGVSLTELRDRFRSYLFERYLPFLDEFVIDRDHGGFLCTTRQDGTVVNAAKRAVYEGRGIWIFSFLYGNLESDNRYLDIAKRSADILMANRPSDDEFWPSSFSQEGFPASPPGRDISTDMYIAEGFAELAAVTGDDMYRTVADETVLKCLRRYADPEYGISWGRGYFGGDTPDTPGTRAVDGELLLMRYGTSQLRRTDMPLYRTLAQEYADHLIDDFYTKDADLSIELLDHEYKPWKPPCSRICNIGNSLQALWHVMDEAVRRRDSVLFDTAAVRFKRCIDVARDDVYGGLFNVLTDYDANTWRLGKVLYTHTETLVGLLMISEHRGYQWAREYFGELLAYVEATFDLAPQGYRLWNFAGDRFGTFNFQSSTRIENFHFPRFLMLMITGLDRMIERNGRVSNAVR